jgi:hypothetical protein
MLSDGAPHREDLGAATSSSDEELEEEDPGGDAAAAAVDGVHMTLPDEAARCVSHSQGWRKPHDLGTWPSVLTNKNLHISGFQRPELGPTLLCNLRSG